MIIPFFIHFCSAATTDEERQQMPEVAQFHLGKRQLPFQLKRCAKMFFYLFNRISHFLSE